MGVGQFKIVVFAALISLAGCSTKANPNSCCTSADQCTAVGLKDITDCRSGDVCDPNGACVTPQCTTSADCTSPDTPICRGQLCVSKCTADADCNGLAGTPYCATDGVCVACKDDAQCSPDKPVCDAGLRECRGCEADHECTGGVCLEYSGACAADADVVYVRADGGDTGTCTAAAPCLTLPYAFGKLTSSRNVVHIIGTAFTVGTSTVALPVQQLLYLDGEDTVIRRDAQGPVFTASSAFVSTIMSRVTLGTAVSGNQSLAVSAGTVALDHGGIDAPLMITGGSVEVSKSTVTGLTLGLTSQCSMHGVIAIHDSTLHGGLHATDCTVTLARNQIDSLPETLSVSGDGVATIENNTITSTDFYTDALGVDGNAGSVVRFNTFVNYSGVDMGASVISCGTGISVTSNIFAWHSHTPPNGCTVTYSLFDQVAGLQPGTGNHVGDAATFFADMANKDLHLAAGSPAIGIGESGLPVTTDIEGKPRPQPSGSNPDSGAYEAP